MGPGEPQNRGYVTIATLCVATVLAVAGVSASRSSVDPEGGGGGTLVCGPRVLTYLTALLTGTGSVIKLGVNNGAEPPVSPVAARALGGGGQTQFISGAGAGRVAKGRVLMGLHAFLHGRERGWCRRTNNLLADAPSATGDIEYSCVAAGHFSPHRPPPCSPRPADTPCRGARGG